MVWSVVCLEALEIWGPEFNPYNKYLKTEHGGEQLQPQCLKDENSWASWVPLGRQPLLMASSNLMLDPGSKSRWTVLKFVLWLPHTQDKGIHICTHICTHTNMNTPTHKQTRNKANKFRSERLFLIFEEAVFVIGGYLFIPSHSDPK